MNNDQSPSAISAHENICSLPTNHSAICRRTPQTILIYSQCIRRKDQDSVRPNALFYLIDFDPFRRLSAERIFSMEKIIQGAL